MIFQQFVDDDLGCASYLVGDEDAGDAVVVDPPYAIEPLLDEAAAPRRAARRACSRRTPTPTTSRDTAGSRSSTAARCTSIPPPKRSTPTSRSRTGRRSTSVTCGSARIHTPGHRPEHCCFAVSDRTRADEPWLVLTGDSLFVGDAARPDLAVEARGGRGGALPSPAPAARAPRRRRGLSRARRGLALRAAMSSKASTTIGFERRFNPMALAARARRVRRRVRLDAAPRPPNSAGIVAINRGPFVGAPAPAPSCRRRPRTAGCWTCATRSLPRRSCPRRDQRPGVGPRASRRRRDSSSTPTSPCACSPRAVRRRRAASAAFAPSRSRLAGYVLGGGAGAERPVEVDELDELLAAGVEVIDVRERDERDTGTSPAAATFRTGCCGMCGAELASDRPIVTICESGARAAIAASILARRASTRARSLDGGIASWRARGGETVSFRRCGS